MGNYTETRGQREPSSRLIRTPRPTAVASPCPGFMTTGSGAAGWRTKDTDGNYLAVCRAPEAAENGLRLDALGNLISITVLMGNSRVFLHARVRPCRVENSDEPMSELALEQPPPFGRVRDVGMPRRTGVRRTDMAVPPTPARFERHSTDQGTSPHHSRRARRRR